jgi:hypothetical protein
MVMISRPGKGANSNSGSGKVKPGWYPATVREVSEQESAAGNDMIVMTLDIDVGKREPWERKFYVPLHVAFRVEQLFDAFPDAIDKQSGLINTNSLFDLPCQVELVEEEYNGKTSLKADNVAPLDSDGGSDDLPF